MFRSVHAVTPFSNFTMPCALGSPGSIFRSETEIEAEAEVETCQELPLHIHRRGGDDVGLHLLAVKVC